MKEYQEIYNAASILNNLKKKNKSKYKKTIILAEEGIVIGMNNKKIGTYGVCGYEIVSINNRTEYTHRLIYKYCFGEIPNNKQVDHIDRDKRNNKISNLRLVTRSENLRNRVFKIKN